MTTTTKIVAKPTAAKKTATAAAVGQPIRLVRPKRELLVVQIDGTAPLLSHKWSVKARAEMLAKQQGKKVAKTPKDPVQDFEESRYKFADGSGDGFPVTGIKKSIVQGAGRMFGKSVKMTELRQALYLHHDGLGDDGAQLVRLQYAEGQPVMNEAMVRVPGSADIRYRALYEEWSALLRISYYPHLIDAESVLALIDAGGINGIGEWRPEKDGILGTYEVAATFADEEGVA